MTSEELKAKIKTIIPTLYKARQKVEAKAVEYDELTKFPELKEVIVDLLTADFDSFLASIDWVAPRPTTFRINLKNGEEFYLIYNNRICFFSINSQFIHASLYWHVPSSNYLNAFYENSCISYRPNIRKYWLGNA